MAPMLKSCLCTQSQLESDLFVEWGQRIRPAWDAAGNGKRINLHRKVWEWVFIIQALHERGMLAPGRRGLGFGVGREPHAAFFASLGCDVVATDLGSTEAMAAHWAGAAQHAASLEQLNTVGLCDPEVFRQRVTFRPVDMNHIPSDLNGFDFTWSSCAFEHLGSIAQGQDFILEQMRCLRPGGVAVHTTEFNLSSQWRTLDWKPTVLFRRRDIEELVTLLRDEGHDISVDFDPGNGVADRYIDVPPYGDVHLKLQIEKFQVTSLGLIITKSRQAGARKGRLTRRIRRLQRQVGVLQRRGDEELRHLEDKARELKSRVRRFVNVLR